MAANYLTRDITRAFGIFVFSAMFAWDIIENANDFGWDNAGIYAVVVLGDTAIIKLAEVIRGGVTKAMAVSQSNPNRVDSSDINPANTENKPVAQ